MGRHKAGWLGRTWQSEGSTRVNVLAQGSLMRHKARGSQDKGGHKTGGFHKTVRAQHKAGVEQS